MLFRATNFPFEGPEEAPHRVSECPCSGFDQQIAHRVEVAGVRVPRLAFLALVSDLNENGSVHVRVVSTPHTTERPLRSEELGCRGGKSARDCYPALLLDRSVERPDPGSV